MKTTVSGGSPRWLRVPPCVLLFALTSLQAGPARAAAPATLVADIEDGPGAVVRCGAVGQEGAVLLRRVAIFAGDDCRAGSELWRTDGTAAGTFLVRDIAPGIGASDPTYLTIVGSRVLFFADDRVHGRELWTTDGTPEGTGLVADIRPGPGNALDGASDHTGGPLARLGDHAYFFADDGVHGLAIWRSDGTLSGTALVVDFAGSPPFSPQPRQLVATEAFGGAIVFTVRRGYLATEVWRANPDGSHPTVLATGFDGAGACSPGLYATVGDRVFFRAGNEAVGCEPWATDGTPSGTRLLADIRAGIGDSWPSAFFDFDGLAVFGATGSGTGDEPWISDGTPGGTRLLKNVNPGARSSYPGGFRIVDGKLRFTAYQGQAFVVWQSDGSKTGTVPVPAASLVVAMRSSYSVPPYHFVQDPDGRFSLWKSDARGDRFLTLFSEGAWVNGALSRSGDLLFSLYVDFGSTPTQLWRSDGTPRGTFPYASLETATPTTGNSDPDHLAAFGDSAVFAATSLGAGREPWITDGSAPGTAMIADVRPGSGGSDPHAFVAFGGAMLFFADDGVHGPELWRTDGTAPGTRLVADVAPGPEGSSPAWIGVTHSLAYFYADDVTHGAEPWVTDGTNAGTRLVRDLRPGLAGSRRSMDLLPVEGAVLGDQLIFAADDGEHGIEAWESDGTEDGTVLLVDAFPGAASGIDGNSTVRMVAAETPGRVFFVARDGVTGRELWSTDGTPEGTELSFEINPGPEDGYVDSLTVVRDRLFFAAYDSAEEESGLYRSDGTPGGTARLLSAYGRFGLLAAGDELYATRKYSGVAHIDPITAVTTPIAFPQPPSDDGNPANLSPIGSGVFAAVDLLERGWEPFYADGTSGVVSSLGDLRPGPGSSLPGPATVAGTRAYFAATDAVHGRELWSFSIEPECGNGLLEIGETCDPIAEGCCSATCALIDGDGDGTCDRDDPCIGGGEIGAAKLRVKGLDTPAADDRVNFSGDLVLDASELAGLAPFATGLRVIVRGPGRAILDATLPPGAYTAAARRGWRVGKNGRIARWSDRSGETRSEVSDLWVRPGAGAREGVVEIGFRASRLAMAIAASELPLEAEVVLDPRVVPSSSCHTARFDRPRPAPACELGRPSGRVVCR